MIGEEVRHGEAEVAEVRVKEGERLCTAGRGARLECDACTDAIDREGGGSLHEMECRARRNTQR
jgi:hypothetical protein